MTQLGEFTHCSSCHWEMLYCYHCCLWH